MARAAVLPAPREERSASDAAQAMRPPSPGIRPLPLARPNRLALALPALAAAYPVLFVAANNVGEFGTGELILVSLAMAALGSGLLLLAWLPLRRRMPVVNVALLTTVAIVFLCWTLLLTASLAHDGTLLGPAKGIVPPMALLSMVAAWALFRARRPQVEVARFAVVMTVVLALFSLEQLIVRLRADERQIRQSAAVSDVLQPIRAAAAPVDSAPDIYLIILDNYANAAVQASFFGESAQRFEDQLRALGFVVPTHARSNYSRTAYSVASMLNAEHLDGLERDFPRAQDVGVLYRLIEESRVVRFLKGRGYRFVLYPSTGFHGTQRSPLADARYVPPGDFVRGLVANSVLATAVWSLTVPGRFLDNNGYGVKSAAMDVRTLEGLPGAAGGRHPVFALSHVMVTHPPFQLDASCKPSAGVRRAGDLSLASYRAQLTCTNRELLLVINDILRRSPRPPVIILQGDHGTATTLSHLPKRAEDISARQASERFDAFGAYLLPGHAAAVPADTVTPVNVFRMVLNEYFGTALPFRENKAFFVVPGQPFHFVPVHVSSPASVRGEAGGQRAMVPPARSCGRSCG